MQKMVQQNIIIDSDWGGDVFQLTSVLLARPQEFNIVGGSVTFGNASLQQNSINAGAVLRLMGADNKIPLYAGAQAALGKDAPPKGDRAHGTDGLGGVDIPISKHAVSDKPSVDFILDTLLEKKENTVTLVVTAPQTNIATAIQKDLETMKRVKEIRIMGGCMKSMPGWKVTWPDLKRIETMDLQGNITPHAEFNVQQDPQSAKIVLSSGLPIALFPMNCTHQLTFTKERQAQLFNMLSANPAIAQTVSQLIDAPKAMDNAKFGIDSVMHDISTTVSMIAPNLYEGRRGSVSVNTNEFTDEFGKTTFTPDENGSIWVAETITDPNAAFNIALQSFQTVLTHHMSAAPKFTAPGCK